MSARHYIYIVSSMRAGSTLLKALLATRPDVSDLPEIHFNRSLNIQSDKDIVVIKAPAYYNNFDYPQLPVSNARVLLLIRNPYDTIISLKKMNEALNMADISPLNHKIVLLSYWVLVYQNLIEKFSFDDKKVFIVRYEDLTDNPLEYTRKIFEFIGTKDTNGTETYAAPKNYEWKWGSDDGGNIIKTLKVQLKQCSRTDEELITLIRKNMEVIEVIMREFGYLDFYL